MLSLFFKRKVLVIFLILVTTFRLVSAVFAAPHEDGVQPTSTFTPTSTAIPTNTPIPTALPEPTDTPIPNAENLQSPTETPLDQTTSQVESNVAESSDTAAAAGSSVLGFLLCTGLIIVAGLAALNIWAQRRP